MSVLPIREVELGRGGSRPDTPPSPQAHEVKTVLRARSVLVLHGLDSQALAEASHHLRASYALKHGIQAYVGEMIGSKLARLPMRRFRLFAHMASTQIIDVPEGHQETHLDDYLARYDHRHMPERVELIQGRADDELVYFL